MSVVGSNTILQGGSALIRLTLTGTAPWTVQWSDMPGQPQQILSGDNPYTRSVSPTVSTAYTVTASDAYACAMSIQGAPVTIHVKPPAPTDLVAVAASSSVVHLTWWFEGQANRFDVYRSGALIGNVIGSMFTYADTTAQPSAAYVYTVRAVRENVASDPSNRDLVSMIVFSDDPALAQTTVVRAEHITQLQAAVNAVRMAAGMSAVSFTTIVPGVTPVSASHLEELRSALAPARASLGLPGVTYARSPLSPGMLMLATDLEEIRDGVR